MNTNEIDNLNDTIAHAIQQMKAEQGDKFSMEKINVAELSRRTGISRKKLHNAQKNNFVIQPNGTKGRKRKKTVLAGAEFADATQRK